MHNPAFETIQALNIWPLEFVQDSSSLEQRIALLLKLARLLLSRALLARHHLPFPDVFPLVGSDSFRAERHILA